MSAILTDTDIPNEVTCYDPFQVTAIVSCMKPNNSLSQGQAWTTFKHFPVLDSLTLCGFMKTRTRFPRLTYNDNNMLFLMSAVLKKYVNQFFKSKLSESFYFFR